MGATILSTLRNVLGPQRPRQVICNSVNVGGSNLSDTVRKCSLHTLLKPLGLLLRTTQTVPQASGSFLQFLQGLHQGFLLYLHLKQINTQLMCTKSDLVI